MTGYWDLAIISWLKPEHIAAGFSSICETTERAFLRAANRYKCNHPALRGNTGLKEKVARNRGAELLSENGNEP